MRIVIATFNRDLVGGTEKYLQAILPALIKRGHQVALLYEIPFNPRRESIDPPEASMTAWCLAELGVGAAMQSVTQWKPDVVYNQGLQDGDLEDALLDTFPAVLFAHGYYGTCGTGSKCHSFPRTPGPVDGALGRLSAAPLPAPLRRARSTRSLAYLSTASAPSFPAHRLPDYRRGQRTHAR